MAAVLAHLGGQRQRHPSPLPDGAGRLMAEVRGSSLSNFNVRGDFDLEAIWEAAQRGPGQPGAAFPSGKPVSTAPAPKWPGSVTA